MNIPKSEHVLEPIFPPTLVAAVSSELFRILKCAEENVPQRDVRKVVGMMAELMMDAVRFWPLEDESKPRRRVDVPVIKEFTDRNKNCVVSRGSNAAAE